MANSYTNPFVPMPDAEANIVGLLANDQNIGQFSPVGISTSMMGYTNTQLWIHVTRIGGVPAQLVGPDMPQLQFNVYAPEEQKAIAQALAQTVRAVIIAMRGSVIGNPGTGMKLAKAQDVHGMAYLPDKSGFPRYTFAMSLTTMPI